MPEISVIMPAYNAEKYISEAIESILSQTYSDFEFIIINDGSADRTEDIVLSYDDKRIVYIKNERNCGIVYTLNKGLKLAKGKYIARMDSDDISLPERFEKQIEFMEKNPDVAVCGGNMLRFNDSGELSVCSYPTTDRSIKTALLFLSPFGHPTVMIRNRIIRDNNIQYDASFEKTEDFYLWTVLRNYGSFANLNLTVLKYRIHNKQISQNFQVEKKQGLEKIIKRNMEHYDISIPDIDVKILAKIFGFGIEKNEINDFCRIAKKILQLMSDELDSDYLKTIFKGIIIEFSLSNKIILPARAIQLIGPKPYFYICLHKIIPRGVLQ